MNPVAEHVTKYTQPPYGRPYPRKQARVLKIADICISITTVIETMNKMPVILPFFGRFWAELRSVRDRQGGIVVSTSTGKFMIFPKNGLPRRSAWKKTL
jgi:hypothetical protein